MTVKTNFSCPNPHGIATGRWRNSRPAEEMLGNETRTWGPVETRRQLETIARKTSQMVSRTLGRTLEARTGLDEQHIVRQRQLLTELSQRLDDANSVETAVDVRNKADLVRRYAQNVKVGLEFQNEAAEIRLRAERAAGRLLKSLNLRGGDRKSNGHDDRLILSDFGISQSQSKRWQRIAAIPDKKFVGFLREAKTQNREITSAALLRTLPAKRSVSQKGGKPIGRVESPERIVTTSCAPDRAEVRGLVEELSNHLCTMEKLLSPVLSTTDDFRASVAVRRHLKRLFAEMKTMLETVKTASNT